MRNLIALAIAASVSFTGYSAPAFAAETTVKANVACVINSPNVQSYKWVWFRGGRGNCNGSVVGDDIAAIATKAAGGQRVSYIAFHIPSVCVKGDGWAEVKVIKVGNELRAYPWDKKCTDGKYFAAR